VISAEDSLVAANESPGSRGEHVLQEKFGSSQRARAFYRSQMRDRLNPWMQEFIADQEMVFIASADARGECDCSFRAGAKGFVRILDERTLAYPEYRGNGVYASLGNFVESPHIGMLFVDFFRHTIGLHVNGSAALLAYEDLIHRFHTSEELRREGVTTTAPQSQVWVVVGIEEAYLHCAKHLPKLAKLEKPIDFGTDDPSKKKGGDHFHVNEWS
jgi:predicted pyridoxine 5'-phosphate oxidase superfamily flavin-nucleotide-binding protein